MRFLSILLLLSLMSTRTYGLANKLRVVSFAPLQLAVSKSEINLLINQELSRMNAIPVEERGFKGDISQFNAFFVGTNRLKVEAKLKGKYKNSLFSVGINGNIKLEAILRVENWQYVVDVQTVDISVSNDLVNAIIGTIEILLDETIRTELTEALNKDSGSFIDFSEAHPIAQRIRDASSLSAQFNATDLILTLNQR
ncbi:hypothetical protein [Pseudobacteriovorax antillogorgiicola]|uniref:Uncharacterized protein n=1 Tax=Pseudobacteriovorax antillogorgiicola TaxID=1513793 RepID=A0A1Y6BQC1_9BACT|nr:hypothetical protein [Pseudobacteriovorax antillogorgiicola]TCS53729.1 hypothetical protein EDD56_10738 [Pseudobacteriovorax antillogorgiicola]SMF22758.1 hypothetical protein SAMN06296036_107234 [Pseudobacteriovorax antillogorgiicola]